MGARAGLVGGGASNMCMRFGVATALMGLRSWLSGLFDGLRSWLSQRFAGLPVLASYVLSALLVAASAPRLWGRRWGWRAWRLSLWLRRRFYLVSVTLALRAALTC